MDRDGKRARVVASWLRDGSHPTWLLDGRVSMNFRGRLCAFRDVEGARCEDLGGKASGHPQGVLSRARFLGGRH